MTRSRRESLCACPGCGVERMVRDDSLKLTGGRCLQCAMAVAGAAKRGKPNTTRRRGRMVACPRCEKQFWRTRSSLIRRPDAICSIVCRWNDQPREDRHCPECGKTFTVVGESRLSRSMYCSDACARIGRRGVFRGMPALKPPKRMGARTIKRKFLQRFGNDICSICGKVGTIELHHMVPYRLTQDDSDANLVPLCHEHHVIIQRISDKLAEVPSNRRDAIASVIVGQLEEQRYRILTRRMEA